MRFPTLLSDGVDETGRPLSQRNAADLAFTKLLERKLDGEKLHEVIEEKEFIDDSLDWTPERYKPVKTSTNVPESSEEAGTSAEFGEVDVTTIPMPAFTGIKEIRMTKSAPPEDSRISLSKEEGTVKLQGITKTQLAELLNALAHDDGLIKDAPALEKFISDLIELNPLEVVDGNGDEMVYALDEPEFLIIEIALDSGAGDHVISMLDLPGAVVRDSRGSRSGQHFLAAGGQRLPNQGEMALTLIDERTSATVDSVFQVAEVTRPLWSVGKVCDKGYKVLFDALKAEIFKNLGDAPLCTFERKGGLYIGRLKVKNPRHEGFARPGR